METDISYWRTTAKDRNKLKPFLAGETTSVLQFSSSAYTQHLSLSQFLKADAQTAEAHTKSAKPDTNYQPLTQFSIS